MHLAQSHTYGPLARAEDARTLTVAQNLAHLDRIVGTVEWFHASVREHDRPWAHALLDTLHLTHCVRPGVVNWPDVAEIDAASPHSAANCCFWKPPRRNLEPWHRTAPGSSIAARVRHKIRMQPRSDPRPLRPRARNPASALRSFSDAKDAPSRRQLYGNHSRHWLSLLERNQFVIIVNAYTIMVIS